MSRESVDPEERDRNIGKSKDPEQEAVLDDQEHVVNLDLDVEVRADQDRVRFHGLDLDPLRVNVKKDQEVPHQAAYQDLNQDRDLNRITEVVPEIVIVEDVILPQNRDQNHAQDQNLKQDQDLGLKAIIVNDRVVLKIKCKHCQDIMAVVANPPVLN